MGTLRLTSIPKDPYLGYEAPKVAREAAACLHCASPAPCTMACPNQSDIPGVMRLAGHAACEGLALRRWSYNQERVEASRITDAITDAYN
jgi:NADPH-dependent glutamate synthase beta subunit-like oxidoreductase